MVIPLKDQTRMLKWYQGADRGIYDTYPTLETNLILGSRLSVECKGPWGQENVFGCETHFHKWGRVQKMEPNDSQVHSHFGSCTCAEVLNG
jgi:hypothetical protein